MKVTGMMWGELKELVEDLIKNHDFHNNRLTFCAWW